AAVALQVRVHARPVAARPAVAVAGHADVDQAGVLRTEALVAQAQPLHHAGAEVLDRDVGGAGQPAGEVDAPRVLEVDGDRALVAVRDQVGGRAVDAA